MDQKVQETMDGTPANITSEDGYINVKFQCGPIKEVGTNGTQITEVLTLLRDRLGGFQDGPFKCRENAIAITKIEEAIHWLAHRTKDRQERGVEGINKA